MILKTNFLGSRINLRLTRAARHNLPIWAAAWSSTSRAQVLCARAYRQRVVRLQ